MNDHDATISMKECVERSIDFVAESVGTFAMMKSLYNKWIEGLDAKIQLITDDEEIKLAHKANLIVQVDVFCAMRELKNTMDSALKIINEIHTKQANHDIPAAFKASGTTTYGNKYGTIYMSDRTTATIVDKQAAFEWLRSQGLGDIITATVNAQTLAATLKQHVKETHVDPDPEVIRLGVHTSASIKSKKSTNEDEDNG